MRKALITLSLIAASWPVLAQTPAATFQIKALTPETALKAARRR